VKIIQAVGWYYPDRLGGTEVYVAGLAGRLQAAGHQVLVAAPEPGAPMPRAYDWDGVSVYRYPTPGVPTREECQEVVPALRADQFHAWMHREQPDVVHFHTFTTGLGLHEIAAAKATGARVVATTHSSSLGYICDRGTMMRWGREPCDGICRPSKCAACKLQQRGLPKPVAAAIGRVPPAGGRRLRSLPGRVGTALAMSDLIVRNQAKQRAMIEHVDRFVLLTEWARDVVVRNGAPWEKVEVNRLGVSQSTLERKRGPDAAPTVLPVRVGYLGRFEDIKGVVILARAVALLKASVPIEVEFRGPVRSRDERILLEELRALTAGDPRVRFAPAVRPEEAPRVLASYDLLCCPSLCAEGGPTVAIEAHAVGTPVIGSRIGGLAELVNDGRDGRLIPPGDALALARVMEEVAADPAGTVDQWRRALPPARTMDQIAADYLTLYETVLSDHREASAV
jgi:glycosyltransferase involved in cell wall biosynthesis